MTVYTSDHLVMPYSTVQWIEQHCSCVYSAKPLVRLITTIAFACIDLPESTQCCVDFCTVVQHSYPLGFR